MIHSWKYEIKNPIDESLIFPRYDGLSLVNIPNTILNLYGISGPNPPLEKPILKKIPKKKKTILFLIDGLGFLQWEKYSKENKLLNTISNEDDVFPLTSIFPSTTPAAITTVNSGLTPSEHGLPEWFVYLKEIDMVIESLPFMPVGTSDPDFLQKEGHNPHLLFNEKTIYQRLGENNVKSYAFLDSEIANSAYNSVALTGSEIISYSDEKNLLENLSQKVVGEKNQSYFYVYWGGLDSLAHKCGPYSETYKKALNKFSEIFIQSLDKDKFKDTTFLFIADHGQIDIDPKESFLLNNYPEIMNNLDRKKDGPIIFPWGNCRDVFLQVKSEKLVETETILKEKFADKAYIIKTDKLVEYGLFGTKFSSRFIDRIGNLMIIPTKNNTVWYVQDKKSQNRFNTFKGHHGGLSKEEMLIPFGIWNP